MNHVIFKVQCFNLREHLAEFHVLVNVDRGESVDSDFLEVLERGDVLEDFEVGGGGVVGVRGAGERDHGVGGRGRGGGLRDRSDEEFFEGEEFRTHDLAEFGTEVLESDLHNGEVGEASRERTLEDSTISEPHGTREVDVDHHTIVLVES